MKANKKKAQKKVLKSAWNANDLWFIEAIIAEDFSPHSWPEAVKRWAHNEHSI